MPERHPETRSIHDGHDPRDHQGALKPPIYETTTYAFATAEEMEAGFAQVYGLAEAEGPDPYIYGRLDSPNVQVAEARVSAWEGAEGSLMFSSGMAALSTLLLTLGAPGKAILHSTPVYGGTAVLINGLMARYGVRVVTFDPTDGAADLKALASEQDIAVVYVETPANPTNDLFDIALAAGIARDAGAPLVVDNTFLSPVWQRPLDHGATYSVHSATKYLGGHSDLTAGVVSGSESALEELRHNRYRWGTTASPRAGWLLGRSLETLRLRVEKQTENATRVARFLDDHENVNSVSHLSLLTPGDRSFDLYKRQCLGPGAMISFEVEGGKGGAFRLLNALQLIGLATSLGGSESIASHPGSTSHSTMSEQDRIAAGVTPGLIRLSVGVEDGADLVEDLASALGAV